MHPAGEKRGRPNDYTAEALESIKQDLTRFQVQTNHGTPSYQPQLRYTAVNGRNDGSEHHYAKPPIDVPTSASPSIITATQATQLNGHVPKVMSALIPPKLNRKPSIEREMPLPYLRGSPALDSGAGSSRSDSPHSHQQVTCNSRASTGQYSPSPSSFSDVGPPAPPPRNPTTATSATPPPPPPNQMYKRRSPATTRPAAITPNPTRGTSPVIPQNGIKVQQQLTQQMKALSLYQSGGTAAEPPPPYPINTAVVATPAPPPSYTASMQSRQSPTQSQSDYRKSPSSGIYSATSAGSPSPITVTNSAILPPLQATAVARPQPRVYQTRTQQPIIMQSVKSTQVQKPVLQTAVAPQSPVTASACNSPVHNMPAPPSYPQKPVAAVPTQQLQQQQQQQQQQQAQQQTPPIIAGAVPTVPSVKPPSATTPPLIANALNGTVVSKPPCVEPPSYAKSMQAKAAQHHQQHPHQHQHQPTQQQVAQAAAVATVQQQQQLQAQRRVAAVAMAAAAAAAQQQKQPPAIPVSARQLPPPPPYQSPRLAPAVPPPTPPAYDSNPNNGNNTDSRTNGGVNMNLLCNNNNLITNSNLATTPPIPPAKNAMPNTGGSGGSNGTTSSNGSTAAAASPNFNKNNNNNESNCKKIKHASPIPERKKVSKEKEEERNQCRIRQYSPQAFKFYMEQHVENVLKSYKQRTFRKNQLEKEMLKMGLSPLTQVEMRKMLNQKESNYIRLKRAKMDKSMFMKIKPIGVGAFGEVTLVRKIDTTNHLYAMKTLRKADVLKRNQVAHVKAERDILAEADNNWVVKLYYSFQDKENLYFVMDYIPGGDLMSLLIKKGVFEEPLARFYIAELTCAVESVHKMGFIHRDIKPDNILIDRDGHIKLTDFGLCTGFRWTHNSKYYQENGNHSRQDSMEPWEDYSEGIKPTVLERRRMREHQRVLAHSLVGTPNYIAPEVLERSGYTQLCDWWSVGVILYEMLVGQPPFLANSPLETQHKVINWETTLHIPSQANLTPEATDLVRRLCSSADKRLGKKADEVKAHDFFNGIDFADMRKQQAPYIPKIEHPTDTSNFDEIDPEKLRSNDTNLSGDDSCETDKPFHGFFEFTFRRFFDDKFNPDVMDDQSPVYV